MQRSTALSLSTAGFLALCLCSTARAEPVPPAIQNTYARMIKAYNARDFKTYATFFGPDYTLGSTSRAQYLAEVSTLLKTAKLATMEVTPKKATTRDNIVEVEFETRRRVITKKQQAEIDAMPKDGPQIPNVSIFREVGVDSWKRVRNAWVKVKTVIKSASAVL